MASKLAAARALLNATILDTVTTTPDPIVADMAREHGVVTVARCGASTKSGAPCAFETTNSRRCPVHNRTVKPVAPVAPTVAEAVKRNSVVESVAVQGYTIYLEGEHDASEIKAAILRETSNPWYPVALLLASKKCATLRIVRQDGVKGTPLARINAAITRGRKVQIDAQMRGVKVPADVAYFHKLGIAAHVKDAATWLFVKMA